MEKNGFIAQFHEFSAEIRKLEIQDTETVTKKNVLYLNKKFQNCKFKCNKV